MTDIGLTIALLEAWLSKQGWRLVNSNLERSRAWIGPRAIAGIADEEVLLPESVSTAEDVRQVERALSVLARLLETTPDGIRSKLEQFTNDTTKFRAARETDLAGGIELGDGLSLYAGVKQVVMAAARSQRERRTQFGKRNYRYAALFLRSARLGQTTTGSYVIPVFSPASSVGFDLAGGTQMPFKGTPSESRLVVENLMRSLTAMREAAAAWSSSRSETGFRESVMSGACLEMYRGMAVLVGATGQSGFEVSITWSDAVRRRADVPGEVYFERSLVRGLDAGADALRNAVTEPDKVVSGRVVELSKTAEEGIGPGVITLQASTGVKRGDRVRVALSPDDHVEAIHAYESDHVIAVKGDLMREGNRKWIVAGHIISSGHHATPLL